MSNINNSCKYNHNMSNRNNSCNNKYNMSNRNNSCNNNHNMSNNNNSCNNNYSRSNKNNSCSNGKNNISLDNICAHFLFLNLSRSVTQTSNPSKGLGVTFFMKSLHGLVSFVPNTMKTLIHVSLKYDTSFNKMNKVNRNLNLEDLKRMEQ